MKTNQKPKSFDISVRPPEANPMFTEWQHEITKFLGYSKPVKCAHCGKMSKGMWTQLKFFRVMEETGPTLKPSDAEYPPLTPVCRKHILAPAER